MLKHERVLGVKAKEEKVPIWRARAKKASQRKEMRGGLAESLGSCESVAGQQIANTGVACRP